MPTKRRRSRASRSGRRRRSGNARAQDKYLRYYEESDGKKIDGGDIPIEVEDFDPGEGLTASEIAVKMLKDAGATEPSSTVFTPHVWYTAYHGQDPHTGQYPTTSYFPKGFSQDELKIIYDGVTQRQRRASFRRASRRRR